MSMQGDSGASQGQAGAQEPAATGAPGSQEGQGSEQQQQGSEYSLASDFLQRVPEAERPILEKYVKQWDAGVTRRFQELHSQHEPYQKLGSNPEQLASALQLMQMIDEKPEVVFNILKAELENQTGGEQGFQGQGLGAGDEFQGVPPELLQKMNQQQQVLELLAQKILSSEQQSQQQQQDKQLEDYLGLLHTEFGEFDEEYVLAKMARGADGADAVKAFHKLVNPGGATNGGRPAPRVLSGGGVVPSDVQNVAKASRGDTKNLVASLLQQAAEGA